MLAYQTDQTLAQAVPTERWSCDLGGHGGSSSATMGEEERR